jgi:hypothetical protein
MSRAHYFYFPLPVPDLERIVIAHQEGFNEHLNELFSDAELTLFERKLDAMAAPFVQPIFTEMTFDDFYAAADEEEAQRLFFKSCQSSICLENLPDFHENPFQVTWLLCLLERFKEVLIDLGGIEELQFKSSYIEDLGRYKNVDTIISSPLEKKAPAALTKAVFPIDFLVQDVYKEIDRLKAKHKIYQAMEQIEGLSEKAQTVFKVMMDQHLDATALLVRSRLVPKDFDDNLERLKFFLRKLP